jgi:serine/threonine protein kinase
MYAKIARGKFKYPTHLSREAKTIIRDLLQPSPNKRLGVIKGGAKSIKKHAWFKSFDWDALLNHKLKAPIKIEVSDPFDMQNFDPVEENEKPRPYKDDGSGWDKDF